MSLFFLSFLLFCALKKQQDQQELPKVKEEEKKAPEKEEPPVEESKDESVTIDPVMQKYMKMIQEKKQKQDTPQKPVSNLFVPLFPS